MEAHSDQMYDGLPVMDSFDVDLVVKVLNHTAFSEYDLVEER